MLAEGMKAALTLLLLSFATVANAISLHLDFTYTQNGWDIESYAVIRHDDTDNPVFADWYLDGFHVANHYYWSAVGGPIAEWFIGTHTLIGVAHGQTFTQQFTAFRPETERPLTGQVPDSGATALMLGAAMSALAMLRRRHST
jgi:hypothetical protein